MVLGVNRPFPVKMPTKILINLFSCYLLPNFGLKIKFYFITTKCY